MSEPLDHRFSGVLVRSPAKGGWTYVVTDWSAEFFGTRGRVRVRATVDSVEFEGAFLALGDGTHKLSFPVALRRTIGKEAGDTVEIQLLERLGATSAKPATTTTSGKAAATRHATLDEVAELALSLDGVTEGTQWNNRTWFVKRRHFVWERPLTKADIKRLTTAGEAIPGGPIIAVMVEDQMEKAAELAEGRSGVFDIAHFKNYPAVLIQLDVATRSTVDELVRTAWMTAANRRR